MFTTHQKFITFQEHSDICLVCEKKKGSKTAKGTHSRGQPKRNNEKLEKKSAVVAATTNGMQQLSN